MNKNDEKVWLRCFGEESKTKRDLDTVTISSESDESSNEGMPVTNQPRKK